MTISAKVIADSVGAEAPRLTTIQCRYPKFIHGELMTHRVFSRNASSSRAIPVDRLIRDVVDDPVYPSFWGKNQPGMQAAEECDETVRIPDGRPGISVWDRHAAWNYARDQAIRFAHAYAKAGYHKQIVNRLLEPYCHINVIVTSTEWSNFFALRCHPDAQPEMRLLAEAMRDAMAASAPQQLRRGDWHLPYIDRETAIQSCNGFLSHDEAVRLVDSAPLAYFGSVNSHLLVKISVARCARVSYLTQEGKRPSVSEDLGLYERLVGSVPLHASPAEHQATPDQFGPLGWYKPDFHGNLRGWCQYRKVLETNHKE